MIIIDGREAGGQMLRTALGLSAITGKPIKIINIRGARQGCIGLKTQHLEGVLAVAQLCNAEVKGAILGSTEIEFVPKRLENKNLNIKISTAGSLSLLYQSLQIPAAFTDGEVKIHVTGGSTASAWSPPVQYTQNVFLPIVRKMGYDAEIKIIKEGFYPKGGAEAEIIVQPVKKLKPIQLNELGKFLFIKGISVVGQLPEHVATRQADGAKKFFTEKGFENIDIKTKVFDTLSPGTSITLWVETENSVLGSNNLGKRGVKAEKIGRGAAEELFRSIQSKSALDKFMTDQLLPFMALANGKSSAKVEEITDHCKTNISICEHLLGCKFSVEQREKIIEVEGVKSILH